MVRLSDEELQDLLAKGNPGRSVDQSLPPQPKSPPTTALTTADRAELAEKVRKRRRDVDGIDTDAPQPAPKELSDEGAQMTTLTVTGPDGTPRRKGAIVDTETGRIIAEQG